MMGHGKKNGIGERVTCMVCGKERRRRDVESVALLRPRLVDLLKERYPDRWDPRGHVCLADVHSLRIASIDDAIWADKAGISAIEEEVLVAVKEHLTMARNLNDDFASESSLGERLADKIASFGGSWGFIGVFGSMILFWVGMNALPVLSRSFDPYPFILLNLFLSTLTALQAPVIMMSQNRQVAKDRLRADNEYRVSLKTELQIRLLTEKLDYLMGEQWQRLLAVQQSLNDTLSDMASRSRKDDDA